MNLQEKCNLKTVAKIMVKKNQASGLKVLLEKIRNAGPKARTGSCPSCFGVMLEKTGTAACAYFYVKSHLECISCGHIHIG